MKSPEALIFDLDGTLWDSIDACVAAWNEVLVDHPSLARVTREDFLKTMGKNHLEICEMYFPSLAFAERDALLKQCYAREVAYFRAHPPALYPGVVEGLQRLRGDYALGLVSNCQREYLDFVLDHCGLRDVFGAAVCFEDTQLSKGQNILRAVASLGVVSAFFVGDTLGDQAAATEAEVSFGFAAYGFGRVEWFDVSFASFGEVVEYFSQG